MERHKNRNVHPGTILLEDILKPGGFDINDTAELLSISPSELSMILEGKDSITMELASSISKVFGGTITFWINMQKDYDEHNLKHGF